MICRRGHAGRGEAFRAEMRKAIRLASIDSIGDSIGFNWDSIEIESGLSKIRLVVCFPIGNNNRLNLPD